MRNENGYGSITNLGGKRRKPWAVRITVGWKDGRQQRKYLGYYKTQKDALLALAEYHKSGLDLDLSKLTLNDVYNNWIERVEKKNLSENIIRIHKMAYNRFGVLGNQPFSKIKMVHLQNWFDNIDLKPGSKIKIRSTMIQIYNYAITNDIVNKNYAQNLEVNEKVEKTGRVFTKEEIDLLWKNQDIPEVRQLLILIYTGMRIGEMLGISRDNIHFDEGYMIGGNKTEAGKNRVIPIHKRILPFVKEQLGDNKWLMQSNRGIAMSYRNASYHLNKLFIKFGMEHSIHDTRKTTVSWLHTSGVPMETIRMIVGHSGKGVTERVYLYKEPSELVEIVNSIEIPY